MATQLVNALADAYAIERTHITMSLVMDRYKDGTFH
jgi:hypothetical protein